VIRMIFSVGPLVLALAASSAAAMEDVTFASLLREMTDRTAIAEFPDPYYTCAQASSYDRRSTSPDDQTDEGWFANHDRGHYLRYEERHGRREGVMMDVDGPGAIVRIWSANPRGVLRVYIDGADEPAFEAPMADLLDGTGPVEPPLAATRARGGNLYLPIPYAEHCKVTNDDPDGIYYQINYRTYEPGAAVVSFSSDLLDRRADLIAETNARLSSPAAGTGGRTSMSAPVEVAPGATRELFTDEGSSAAITRMIVDLDADDLAGALRSTILQIAFDGEETAACPLGDFFGAAPALIPYETWPFTVNRRGAMISRWYMPYERSFRLSVENLGEAPVTVSTVLSAEPYEWNDRSMHFSAGWRIERDIHTRPRRDWNYVTLEGRGVFVGDMLAVTNPVEAWWGEGDEKIYVDNESFPSHFGTGTEDYYGYAWASNEVFDAPYHNQPRCDGPGNYGHTAVNRFRLLDGIPFRDRLRFDMEIWHWKEVDIACAATTYWYARPGATDNLQPITAEMVRTIPQPPPLPPPFTVEGAIEGEKLEVADASEGVAIAPQALWKKNTYSNDQHAWVRATQAGQFVEWRIPVENPGKRNVIVYLTKSWDYGVVQCFVNGEKAGKPIDTFNDSGRGRELGATGGVNLGEFDLGESFTLRIETAGTNENSEPPHYYFGLDCVVVE